MATNSPCESCGRPREDYAEYASEEDLMNPAYTDDLGHWWLCRVCDREDVKELTYGPKEPEIFDWRTGNKIVY